MNLSQEQDQTTSNEFIEGELSEEDLIEIVGGLGVVKVETILNPGTGAKYIIKTTFIDGSVKLYLGNIE